jgi:hypothetical protein
VQIGRVGGYDSVELVVTEAALVLAQARHQALQARAKPLAAGLSGLLRDGPPEEADLRGIGIDLHHGMSPLLQRPP